MTEWRDATVAELCSSVDYGYTAPASDAPGLPRFLRITDIVGSHIDWCSVPGCEVDQARLEKFLLAEGDIVVARTGATVGYGKRIREHPEAVFASYLVRFRPAEGIEPSFLGAVVESAAYKEWVLQHAGGAAQPNANAKTLGAFPLRVPDSAAQRRIGSVLDSIDDMIENNRRRVEVLEEMARAIYREWFVHFRYPGHEGVPLVDSPLGPIPDGWSVRTLRECANVLVDGDWVEIKDQGGSAYRLLQVSNVGLGAFRETGKYRYITEETFQRLNCTEVSIGDILISRMPEPVGRAWLVDHLDEPAVTVVDVALLTPTSTPMGVYLNQVLNSPEQLGRAATVATGTTRKRITRSVLAQSRMLVSNDALLTRFGELCEPGRRMAATLRLTSRTLEGARDLLLPKLVTGQIDVSHLDLDALVEESVA